MGEILDVALRIYRAHAATLLRVAALAAPVIVLVSALGAPFADDTRGIDDGSGGTVEVPTTGALVASLATLVVVTLVAAFVGGALTRALAAGTFGLPVDVAGSLDTARTRLGGLAAVAVLVPVLAGLALLACIAPGVYLFTGWFVAVPALILEQRSPTRAMGRSFELVRGQWWPTFALVLLSGILAAIASFALSAPFEFIARRIGGGDAAGAVLSGIGAAIAFVLVTPFQAAVAVVRYVDLRLRKEPYELEALAHDLGWAGHLDVPPPPPGWSPPPPPGDSSPGWPDRPPN